MPVIEPAPTQLNPSDTDHEDTGQGSKDYNTLTRDRQEIIDTEQLQVQVPVAKLPLNTTESLYRTHSGQVSKPNPKYRDFVS